MSVLWQLTFAVVAHTAQQNYFHVTQYIPEYLTIYLFALSIINVTFCWCHSMLAFSILELIKYFWTVISLLAVYVKVSWRFQRLLPVSSLFMDSRVLRRIIMEVRYCTDVLMLLISNVLMIFLVRIYCNNVVIHTHVPGVICYPVVFLQ